MLVVSKLLILLFLLGIETSISYINVAVAHPTPASTTSLFLTPEALPLAQGLAQQNTPAPAMVPVSSTVISVANVKASARQVAPGTYYTRRFRFFDKSSKPDTPIRLITKNTNLKALYDTSKDT